MPKHVNRRFCPTPFGPMGVDKKV